MPNVYEDKGLRQTGRTTEMLTNAIKESLSEEYRVVIVCASARDVDWMRKRHKKILDSMDLLDIKFSGTVFESADALKSCVLSSTSFIFVDEPTGYGSWPKPPLFFVDHHAASLMVNNYLKRMGC